MNRRLLDLAALLVDLPEWLAVRAVTIESGGETFRIPVPFPTDYHLPLPEGSFVLHVEIAPTP